MNSGDSIVRPLRKTLPHGIPQGAKTDSIFFITICTTPRGVNQLCNTTVSDQLLKSLINLQERGTIRIYLVLLMPDHLHALLTFDHNLGMQKILSSWKHYTARALHIHWQRDFFDHRLRKDESFQEKAAYIRANPLRAGLICESNLWPYALDPYGRDGTCYSAK
jgi:putative transposase